jgi:ribonuclease HII
MSGAAGEALDQLRRRAREAASDRELRQLARVLSRDPRGGARELAARIARSLAEREAERRRVGRLFALRRRLRRAGARIVAGVDEVGVGPLAGPLVACAVVLPERVDLPGLDDSKRLPAPVRERLARSIRAQALALALGCASPQEIDELNVLRAGLEAMRRAVAGLAIPPDHVLVDARTIPGIAPVQTALVRGDARDGSIAAASIVAKVYRDALMVRLDACHPGYGFARHKGYPTPDHVAALRALGPSPVHRRSFAPVAEWA